MKVFGIIFFLLLSYKQAVWAQFSMEGYLSNAISDAELQFFKARQDFVNENGFKSPILREVEFRARVRTFEEGFDDYRLRFSPLNPFEIAANKEYQQELKQQLSISYLMNLEEVLLGRYEMMIKHWQITKTKALTVESIRFNEQMLIVLRSQAAGSAVKDYIRTDKALLKQNLKFEELTMEQATLEAQIKQTYPFEAPIQWDSTALTDIATINDWLSRSDSRDYNNNLSIKNEQQKEAVAAAEYRIDKQESFSNIGYVQAEYRANDQNSFNQNIGMQIGVTLPITNPDKPDLQRRKLDMLEDSQAFELEKQNLQAYLNKLFLKLETLLRQYAFVEAKINVYANHNFIANNATNALDVLLELEEFTTELNQKKIELTAAIYSSYINLLSINSRLSQAPYTNYLSKDNRGFNLEY